MSYEEQAIEDAAFEHGLSLPTVRTMARLCDQLQAEHGDAWTEQHLADLVDEGLASREPWALEFAAASAADAYRPLLDAAITKRPHDAPGE